MNKPTRRFGWFIWGGLLLLAATLLLALLLAALKTRTEAAGPLPVYGEVADFTLTNQDGVAVSLAGLRGHVWVADIIFTRCPGPCMRMSRQMKELQDALPTGGSTKFVSLTTDPDYDTPAILKTYGERNGVDTARWTFLTATKNQIHDLAVGSL